MWKNLERLIKKIREEPWTKTNNEDEFWEHLSDWLNERILPDFLTEYSNQVDEIIDIDPDLSEHEIFARVNRYMVEFLGARSASVRLYDPHTEQMLSYGSYPSEEESREPYIPLEGSVAGEVVKHNRTYLVPNILEEHLYQDKDVIKRKGTYSVMAVPLAITPFSPQERDTVGVIQIYFPENNRTFTPLEVQMAEIMAGRLSFVLARKKILSMNRINEKKEAIVRNIFLKLGSRGGVKMTEVFNRVVPELVDIISIQSCALFSVTNDLDHVVLDAGYPDSTRYHGIGKQFSVHSEPVFEIILNLRDYDGDSTYETVTPSYVLVMDPQRSGIVS